MAKETYIKPLAIKEIDAITGYVTFDDGTTDGTSGTKQDCDAYGYKFENRRCCIPGAKQKRENTHTNLGGNNKLKGTNIKVDGSKNIVYANNALVHGTNHYIQEDYITAFGNGGSGLRYGEFVQAQTPHPQTVSRGNIARSQRSVLMFQGQTTDNNYTEIYLGGIDGKRFVVDEGKECVIGFEAYVLAAAVNGSKGDAMSKFQHASFLVTSGGLTQLGSTSTKTNNKSHSHSWNNRFTATSGTPDYIKVECQGHSETIDWTVILYVNEMRTTLI